jgi:ATP-binding cassette subfamily C protein
VTRLFGLAASALVRVGFRRRSAKDILRDLSRSRWRLTLTLVASMVAPLAEIGFIVLLYALVEPAQKAAVINAVARVRLDWFQDAMATGNGYIAMTAVGALVLLSVTIASKAIYGHLQAHYLFESFIIQSRRIVAAYLSATPARAMSLDRSHVANVAAVETGLYGKVVFSLLDALTNVVGAVLFSAAATAMAPGLVALAVLLAAVTFAITHRGFALQKKLGVYRVRVQATLLARVWEILNGYRTIKIEAGERKLLDVLWRELQFGQKWRVQKQSNEQFIKLGSEATLYVALLAMIVLATSVFGLAPSLVLMFLVVLGRLQKYVSALQQAWINVQHAIPSVNAIAEVLEACEADGTSAPELAVATPRPETVTLAFDDVTFSYNEGTPVLRSVNFVFNPGDRVLIQGPSGEGKSTLLFLAAGLLRPTAGTVRINGGVLNDDVFYRMRRVVTYLAPNVYLFRGSIRENLCLDVDYPDAEIQKAVDLARLRGLVDRLPQGIDSDIGEDGCHLSLGERQRIMLARIFLKRPLLVLMDEATTNLDLENEAAVLRDLWMNIDRDAIVMMVTHRAPVGVDFSVRLDLHAGTIGAPAVLETHARKL